jgi:hypothetical protein
MPSRPEPRRPTPPMGHVIGSLFSRRQIAATARQPEPPLHSEADVLDGGGWLRARVHPPGGGHGENTP